LVQGILFSAQIPPDFVTEIRDTPHSLEPHSLVSIHTALSPGQMDLILEEECLAVRFQENLSLITSSHRACPTP
jgi:hypothetical protein